MTPEEFLILLSADLYAEATAFGGCLPGLNAHFDGEGDDRYIVFRIGYPDDEVFHRPLNQVALSQMGKATLYQTSRDIAREWATRFLGVGINQEVP